MLCARRAQAPAAEARFVRRTAEERSLRLSACSTIAIVTALLAACVPTPQPRPVSIRPSCCRVCWPGMRIEGFVRDTTGTPVAGVQVRLVGTCMEAVTDERGHYMLNGSPLGRVHLRAEYLGYVPTDLVASADSTRGTTTFVDIVLQSKGIQIVD